MVVMPFSLEGNHRSGIALAVHLKLECFLAICRPSGCTVASRVVVIGIVVIGVCNHSQMRTTKCTCLIFGVRIGLDPG